jgi:aspartate aminotransferase
MLYIYFIDFIMFIAERISWIKQSCTIAMSVKAKNLAATGKDVIDLGVGEPDLHTPQNIKQGGIDAINNNKTKYTLMNGIVPLREAICKTTNNQLNTDYKISNVLVAPGAKYTIFTGFMATINAGDEVIIPAPYWVSYSDIVSLFGGVPVIIQTDPEKNFKLTAEQLLAHVTPKTKWLLLNSPSNPTGAIYTASELKELSDILLQHKIWLMTDDIYEHLRYDNREFTNMVGVCPEMKNQTLIVNGFSKGYCMTGWRLGYGIAPEELINAMAKLQSQSTSSVCEIAQEAGLTALTRQDKSDIITMRDLYQERRNIAFEMLSKIKGLKPYMPDGAFYIFVDIKSLIGLVNIKTDEDFCIYVLENYFVSIVHGTAFGMEGYFRISFATTEIRLCEAINRIEKAVLNLQK